jgi:outer membrane protein TolC
MRPYLKWMLIACWCLPLAVFAQEDCDTTRMFSQDEFFGWVLRYHPAAKQARLLDAETRAIERFARGAFDPILYAEWDQKSFDQKEYFAIGEGGVKIPTWYGIELKGAYLVTDGLFLNPERNLPDVGQAVLGLKVPLARGLFIDERRAALEQAKIMAQANEAERMAILNNLMLSAASAFWDWTVAYNQALVQEQALELTRVRLEAIVESFIQGDLPAIDTLETIIQLQNIQASLLDARIAYRNAGLQLSNFLWDEDGIPLRITACLVPPELEELPVFLPALGPEALWQEASQAHPEIRRLEARLAHLDVSRRLAAEQLKPRLDVEYNFLGEGANFINGAASDPGLAPLFAENYKWGLTFGFPLFLRRERGRLDLAKLQIMNTEFGLEQRRLDINNLIYAQFNELDNLRQQIGIAIANVRGYRDLLNAEIMKFDLGESSIFLINTREQQLIGSELKLAELRGKFFKSLIALEWAAGRLGE